MIPGGEIYPARSASRPPRPQNRAWAIGTPLADYPGNAWLGAGPSQSQSGSIGVQNMLFNFDDLFTNLQTLLNNAWAFVMEFMTNIFGGLGV